MNLHETHAVDPYRRGLPTRPAADETDFGFLDALDIVNPLQHIPVVGWLYREFTGDTIKPAAAIAGGALFGGPVGFASAVLTAAMDSLSDGEPLDFLARTILPGTERQATEAYSRAAALAESPIQR